MMEYWKKGALILGLSGLLLSSFAVQAETLQEAVAHTLQTNPDVLVTAKVRRASEEGVHAAVGNYFPRLDVNAGVGRERSRSVSTSFSRVDLWRSELGAQINQLVFDGMETYHEVERNKAKTDADAYQVWGTSEDVALLVAGAYIDVLRDRKIVRIAQRNVTAHQRTYKMIKRRSQQGVGRAADDSQAFGRLELAKANLVAAQSNLRDSITTYHKVTGIFPSALMTPPSPTPSVLPRTQQDGVLMALANHPILKAAESDVKEAHEQHMVSQAIFFPRIDAVLTANDNHNVDGSIGADEEYSAMLQMKYNVFNGGTDYARARETAYQEQEAAQIRNRTRRQVIESMRLSWNAVQSAQQRLPSLKEHMDASAITVKAYRQQFKLGKRTLLDLLDAENESFTSQIAYVRGKNDVLLGKYRVLNSMGKILPYLNVPLPTEAHVPFHVIND